MEDRGRDTSANDSASTKGLQYDTTGGKTNMETCVILNRDALGFNCPVLQVPQQYA